MVVEGARKTYSIYYYTNTLTAFNPSPFDELILILGQSKLTPLGEFIYSQAKVLRIIYISYSPFVWPTFEQEKKLSNEEILTISDSSFKTALDYFSLINELNQSGRYLRKEFQINLPNLEEIYFFRNKVLEHWDDYINSKPQGGAQIMGTSELPIPLLFGKKRFDPKDSIKLKNNLINEFSKHGVTLSLSDVMHIPNENYSKDIFCALKKIDPEIKSEPKKIKPPRKFIPNQLVLMLLEYEFPLPIFYVKKYCENLATYLKGQKLTI